MAQFYTASALNWTPYGAEYFNRDRELSATNSLILSANFLDCSSLSGIRDIAINHDTVFYLTEKKSVSDLFTDQKESTAFALSSLPLSAETVSLGTSGNHAYVDYYFCPSTPQYNKTTDFKNITHSIPINYLMFSPFKVKNRTYTSDVSNPFSDTLSVLQFNLLNLKNIMTPTYEYDSCLEVSKRDYNKIYLGGNQRFGYNNVYLGYNADTFEIKFAQNDTTYFHYPKDATLQDLSATCLASRGAKPGNSPMNSDILAVDAQDRKLSSYSASGNFPQNSQFLCAWLSGSNNCSCSSTWVERWYDPDTVTQGDAYIMSVKGASSCEYLWDVPTQIQMVPNVRYYYDRYGKDRNDVVVESLSGDMVAHYTKWTDTLVDQTSGGNDGYIIENYKGSSSEFEMDGSLHAHIPPTDELLTRREITVGACVYKDDWCCGKSSQIVGNYRFGGWGIFYNTGMSNNIITVGDDSGNVFSFNIEGTRIFEKDVDGTETINNVSVDYIATDLTGGRWVLDTWNNKLFKIDVDDLLVEILNFPSSYQVDKIQIDPNNRIYLHDKRNDKVFVHDELGTYVETFSAPSSATLFELDTSGNLVFDDGDLIAIASDDTVYKTWGSNLYKNGEVIFHFNDRIMDMKIDDADNIWIIYCGNVLVKIDSDGKMQLKRSILTYLTGEKNAKLGITRRTDKNGCDENKIWLVFEDNQRLVEVSTTGTVLKVIDTSENVIINNCARYRLRANGDFTGYEVNRKYETAGGSNISIANPALTLRVKFTNPCQGKMFKSVHIPVCKLPAGWHHVGLSYKASTGDLKFFVDGVVVGSHTIQAGVWNIDYNDTTPIIIGGTSGKLGSENVEKSIINNQYFIGKIDDLRIFDKALNDFEVRAISDSKVGSFEDLIWNVPITEKNYIEKIERFFMFKKPGHATKKFNLKINGLDIPSDLKLLVESAISGSIKNLIPAYTELNSIVWE